MQEPMLKKPDNNHHHHDRMHLKQGRDHHKNTLRTLEGGYSHLISKSQINEKEIYKKIDPYSDLLRRKITL